MTDVQQGKAEIASALWRLSGATNELDLLYEENHGVETDSSQALTDWVASASDGAIEALCDWLDEVDGFDELCRQRIGQLQELRQRNTHRTVWGKERLRDLLRARGVRKVVSGVRTVSLRAANKRVELDAEIPVELLPPDCRITTTRPDKHAIAAALKAGAEIAGARLVEGEEGVVYK